MTIFIVDIAFLVNSIRFLVNWCASSSGAAMEASRCFTLPLPASPSPEVKLILPSSPICHQDWSIDTASSDDDNMISMQMRCRKKLLLPQSSMILHKTCPPPPRKRSALPRRKAPPAQGFFCPPDLEDFFSSIAASLRSS